MGYDISLNQIFHKTLVVPPMTLLVEKANPYLKYMSCVSKSIRIIAFLGCKLSDVRLVILKECSLIRGLALVSVSVSFDFGQ